MEVMFHVRNFGKIKSADVNISNFALFVGNNNSGKTLLMELIYAVLESITEFNALKYVSIKLPMIGSDSFIVGKEECLLIICAFNEYLKECGTEIIREYFNSNTLSVAEVNIEVCNVDEDDVYWLGHNGHGGLAFAKRSRASIEKLISGDFNVKASMVPFQYVLCEILCEMLGMKKRFAEKKCFLPAARTGFMLTYRPYFSKNSAQKGVTKPVHDFLEFLQDYAYTAKAESQNQNILNFIYENMIDGKIVELGDSTYYLPKGTKDYIPLMLASSMVNELVPITKMLTNYLPTNFLFYDEVETSMHPSKQMEMVRLLNRLNNSGMKMIVSTHSDAMARKINNMLLLQHADRPFEEIQSALAKKGISLEKEDLLKGDIHVYQFTNGDDGMSIVEELEFRDTPLMGYKFPQFMDSSLDLYEESKTVMGLDDED